MDGPFSSDNFKPISNSCTYSKLLLNLNKTNTEQYPIFDNFFPLSFVDEFYLFHRKNNHWVFIFAMKTNFKSFKNEYIGIPKDWRNQGKAICGHNLVEIG